MNEGEKSIKTQGQRVVEIDMAKGFVALLVAIGHLIIIDSTAAITYRIIFAYHMPAFFIFAGYCISRTELEKPARKYMYGKVLRLLVPCYVFRMYDVPFRLMADPSNKILPTIWLCIRHPGVEWFLPTLFAAYGGLYLFFRIYRKNRMLGIGAAIILLAFIPYACVFYVHRFGHGNEMFPLQLDSALLGFSFMLIGFLCKRAVERIKQPFGERLLENRAAFSILLLLGGIGCIAYEIRRNYGYVNIAQGKIGDSEFLFYFCALYWTVATLFLMHQVQRMNTLQLVRRYLVFMGKYSLQAYLGHVMLNNIYLALYPNLAGRAFDYYGRSLPERCMYCFVNIVILSLILFGYDRLKKRKRICQAVAV